MNTILCFTAVIFLLNSIAIQVEKERQIDLSINKPVKINWLALKEFKNRTGETFGDAQLRSLIIFINNASYLFNGDDVKTLKYIKDNMDAAFGDQDNQYSVIMQASRVRDFGDATIYCENGTNYAFIGYGAVQRYPFWSLLVYKLYSPSSSYNHIDIPLNRGSGMTADQANKITFIIENVDGTAACDCSNTEIISDKLEKIFVGKWNVVCQSNPVILSRVAIYNSTWIMFKPETCTYFIYMIQ